MTSSSENIVYVNEFVDLVCRVSRFLRLSCPVSRVILNII